MSHSLSDPPSTSSTSTSSSSLSVPAATTATVNGSNGAGSLVLLSPSIAPLSAALPMWPPVPPLTLSSSLTSTISPPVTGTAATANANAVAAAAVSAMTTSSSLSSLSSLGHSSSSNSLSSPSVSMSTPSSVASTPVNAKPSPIIHTQLLQLSAHGIESDTVKFQNVTLNSAKHIAIREQEQKRVAVIDMVNNTVKRLPSDVDSAILNPSAPILALRVWRTITPSATPPPTDNNSSGSNGTNNGNNTNNGNSAMLTGETTLQAYNLETKTRVRSSSIAEPVVFWKWLDARIIAIVTERAVYHWSLDGDAPPERIFDRTPCRRTEADGTDMELPVQITSYRSTSDAQWLLVGGITTARASDAPIVGVQGVLQVYSVDRRVSQPLMDAPAACFAECYIHDDDRGDIHAKPAKLLCFVRAFEGTGTTRALHILQLDVPRDDASSRTSSLPLEAGDFPVALTPNNRAGLLWITTKNGFLFLYDIPSGKQLFADRVSPGGKSLFAAVDINDDDKDAAIAYGAHGVAGLVAVDRDGRVHQFSAAPTLVCYAAEVLNDMELAHSLASRGVFAPYAPFVAQQQTAFTSLLTAAGSGDEKLDAAVMMAVTTPSLRTLATINALRALPDPKWKLKYFQEVSKRFSYNQVESVELARELLAIANIAAGLEQLRKFMNDNRLECSEPLGDLLREHDPILALAIYRRSSPRCASKVVACILLLAYREASSPQPDDTKINEQLQSLLTYVEHDSPSFVATLSNQVRDWWAAAVNYRPRDHTLIISLCDRFKLGAELTRFLMSRDQFAALALYVQRINPDMTPLVLHTLLELAAPVDTLRRLLAPLVLPPSLALSASDQAQRNALTQCAAAAAASIAAGSPSLTSPIFLRSWLEFKVASTSGNVTTAAASAVIHTTYARVLVDSDRTTAAAFLATNTIYDRHGIAEYCRDRGIPELATIAAALPALPPKLEINTSSLDRAMFFGRQVLVQPISSERARRLDGLMSMRHPNVLAIYGLLDEHKDGSSINSSPSTSAAGSGNNATAATPATTPVAVSGTQWLMTELVDGGSLAKALRIPAFLSIANRRIIVEELTHAIHYLHSRGLQLPELKLNSVVLRSRASGSAWLAGLTVGQAILEWHPLISLVDAVPIVGSHEQAAQHDIMRIGALIGDIFGATIDGAMKEIMIKCTTSVPTERLTYTTLAAAVAAIRLA